MKCIIYAVIIVFLALASEARPGLHKWTQYKQKYGKEYHDPEEDNMRMNIYMEKKKLIEEFNREESEKRGFTVGINHLSDWTDDEFRRLNGVRLPENFDHSMTNSPEAQRFVDSIIYDKTSDVPPDFDWRNIPNRVSHVKDQGACGSCWAFSAIGVLEGQQVVRNITTLSPLSEQNIVDCDDGGNGCEGGIPFQAFNFIRHEGGIQDEVSYPYHEAELDCHFSKKLSIFSDNGGAYLPSGDEEKLKEIVAKYGPVSAVMDASDYAFQTYMRGVYTSSTCKNGVNNLNHAVLIVGYGNNSHEGDYWIVKNSWMLEWGEEGYFRIARNKENLCGIATMTSIATF